VNGPLAGAPIGETGAIGGAGLTSGVTRITVGTGIGVGAGRVGGGRAGLGMLGATGADGVPGGAPNPAGGP